MLSSPAKRRVRGCELPFSGEQVVAAVFWLGSTASTFVAFAIYAEEAAELAITLGTYGLFVIISFLAYMYCVTVDVSAPGGFAIPWQKQTQSTERWCRLCGKTVQGLDHHCNWLNTCVGTRTYWAFLILLLASTIQFVLQVLWSVLIAAVWSDEPGTGGYIYLAFMAAFGMAGVLSVGSLLLFHMYLVTQGIGTYDWLLRRMERMRTREAQTAERARLAAAAMAAQTAGRVSPSAQQQPQPLSPSAITHSGLCDVASANSFRAGNTAPAAQTGRQLSAPKAWLGGAAGDGSSSFASGLDASGRAASGTSNGEHLEVEMVTERKALGAAVASAFERKHDDDEEDEEWGGGGKEGEGKADDEEGGKSDEEGGPSRGVR
jgi:hypothetical protein